MATLMEARGISWILKYGYIYIFLVIGSALIDNNNIILEMKVHVISEWAVTSILHKQTRSTQSLESEV